MKRTKNLLLGEVQHYDYNNFSSCVVHYNGSAGRGKERYAVGGEPFRYEIKPEQAVELSRMQGSMGEKSTPELQKLMKGVPSDLIGQWKDYMTVSRSAQIALYDLVRPAKPKKPG